MPNTVRRAMRGVPRSAPYNMLKGYPTGTVYKVGQRMERGRACVERNRSERSKVANVAEWKPPAPLRASRRWGTPGVGKTGGTSPESEYPTVLCCRIYESQH